MTETEWLDGTDPHPMVRFLRRRAGQRKLRLFACACCRRALAKHPHPRQERLLRAVALAERFADGAATDGERGDAYRAVLDRPDALNVAHAVVYALHRYGFVAARYAPWFAAFAHTDEEPRVDPHWGNDALRGQWEEEQRDQEALLRDAVGNPFRPPPSVGPSLTTPAVLTLATAIYDEGRYSDLPVLADALEEAGLGDAAMLAHLRGPGPHARGCFVLDAVLGRA